MTLNITVVSPAAIHQSADLQISRTQQDAEGNWIEFQPNSSKIIPIRYEKWSGLLTYCGIGLWRGKRTDEYAAEWLAGLPKSSTTFRDVVERIRDQGTPWVANISESLRQTIPHSFVLAGFEGGVPLYAIVSNYQSLTGDIKPVTKELRADIRSTTNVHVLVTGIRNAVPSEKKRKLKHLARIGSAGNVIRYELAKVNQLAAQSKEGKKGISAACLTFTDDGHGGGPRRAIWGRSGTCDAKNSPEWYRYDQNALASTQVWSEYQVCPGCVCVVRV